MGVRIAVDQRGGFVAFVPDDPVRINTRIDFLMKKVGTAEYSAPRIQNELRELYNELGATGDKEP